MRTLLYTSATTMTSQINYRKWISWISQIIPHKNYQEYSFWPFMRIIWHWWLWSSISISMTNYQCKNAVIKRIYISYTYINYLNVSLIPVKTSKLTYALVNWKCRCICWHFVKVNIIRKHWFHIQVFQYNYRRDITVLNSKLRIYKSYNR